MRTYLKEHKKSIIFIIVLIIAYTLNSMYLYGKVNEAKAELLEAQKPSYEEVQKGLIDDLYKDREKIITNISKLQNAIIEAESFKEKTEHVIRCEKENMFNEIKYNCSENWQNYPKK